jgi:hypothetical protein
MSKQLQVQNRKDVDVMPTAFHAPSITRGHKSNLKIYHKHRHAQTISRIWNKGKGMKLHRNSSPYLGYLRHAPNMTRTRTTRRNHPHVVRRNLDTVMHSSSVSPYVGFIRHAPPSSRTYNSTSRTSSRKKFIADSAALWEEYLKKYNCSGHLLGGNSLEVACPRNRLNSSSSYSMFRWFGNAPSAGLFQSEYVKDIINPLDYLDMLNKLAYWFIFPIANDATYTFRETNERDYFREVASVVVPFFSSLFRQVLQIDFSHSVGTTFEESVDAEELSREVSSHSQQDSKVSLSTTSYRQLEKDLVENDQEVTTSSYSQENKLFRSISSIDSDEMMSESQGYLDIETILKLPVIT